MLWQAKIDKEPALIHILMKPAGLPVTILTLVLLGGCTWVKPEPGSERIRIASADAVAACTRQGTTRASLRDRVASVQRKPGKVAEEIETLARASALEMGGDTLVPIGPVVNGAREFVVFRCRQ